MQGFIPMEPFNLQIDSVWWSRPERTTESDDITIKQHGGGVCLYVDEVWCKCHPEGIKLTTHAWTEDIKL